LFLLYQNIRDPAGWDPALIFTWIIDLDLAILWSHLNLI
jgi:hypothetical protein